MSKLSERRNYKRVRPGSGPEKPRRSLGLMSTYGNVGAAVRSEIARRTEDSSGKHVRGIQAEIRQIRGTRIRGGLFSGV